MNRRVAVFVVRAIGTLGGLLGASMLYVACERVVSAPADVNPWIWYTFFVGLQLVIALFFIWVAYLIWFRFSPRAIQQVCGLLAFLLVGLVMTLFPATDQANAGSRSLIYLGSIAFALLGYRMLSRYLNKVIFVRQSTPSENPSNP
jgi:hypothetical protein